LHLLLIGRIDDEDSLFLTHLAAFKIAKIRSGPCVIEPPERLALNPFLSIGMHNRLAQRIKI
jgi:hypothetical protein